MTASSRPPENAAALTVAELAEWAELPQVRDACERARDACADLRWHEGLRRRTPEAALESLVRGSRASAELDGVVASEGQARALFLGIDEPAAGVAAGQVAAENGPAGGTGQSPTRQTSVLAAVRVTQAAAGEVGRLRIAPLQVVARMHLAAAEPSLSERREFVGRPRPAGDGPLARWASMRANEEFAELGPAAPAAEALFRLQAVLRLLRQPAASQLPGVVVAAVVHGEIALARPFAGANGLLARALERAIVQGTGVDVTGVAAPECGHLILGEGAYRSALARWSRRAGDSAGRAHGQAWIMHVAAAVTEGAGEGRRIAEAVRRGMVSPPSGGNRPLS